LVTEVSVHLEEVELRRAEETLRRVNDRKEFDVLRHRFVSVLICIGVMTIVLLGFDEVNGWVQRSTLALGLATMFFRALTSSTGLR